MALASYAWGYDGGTYNGKDMRQLVESVFPTPTSGIVSGLAVTQQASPTSTVQVSAGKAIVLATGSGLTGAYHAWNDAALTSPTIDPTTTNGRKDRLILRVSSGVPALEVVKGTAAASPAEPSITGDNYLELALITLPSSTSNITDAMITDRRVYASALGGIVTCTSSTRPSSPRTGQQVFETDTGRMSFYNGSAWVNRSPVAAVVTTKQTTTSTSFTDLTTSGPAVSVTTGTAAIVTVSANLDNTLGTAYSVMSFAVSGATTTAASDNRGVTFIPGTNGYGSRSSFTYYVTGLTAGTNTFTAKYRATAGTAGFGDRTIVVQAV